MHSVSDGSNIMNEKEIKFTQDLFECYSEGNLLPKSKLEDITDRIKLIQNNSATKKSRKDYYLAKVRHLLHV